jgi:hypothetical protein
MATARTFVAFAELLQEWAELPADVAHLPAWGAALAYEMTLGIWRGCNVRVLSADDGLYPLLVSQHSSATLWRNRTHELTARAQSFAPTFVPTQPAAEPVADGGGRGETYTDLEATPDGDTGNGSDAEPTVRTPTMSREEAAEHDVGEPASPRAAVAAGSPVRES